MNTWNLYVAFMETVLATVLIWSERCIAVVSRFLWYSLNSVSRYSIVLLYDNMNMWTNEWYHQFISYDLEILNGGYNRHTSSRFPNYEIYFVGMLQ